MPTITYYLRTGVTLFVESSEDFERLRDQTEGCLDCHESIVIERIETRVLDGHNRRVAIIIPAEAVSAVRIEEPVDGDAGGSAMQHVELP
jgi:hypothetical protein